LTDPSGPRVVVAHEAELSGKKSSPSGGKVVRQHQKGAFPSGASPVVKVFTAIGSASLETSFG